MSVWADGAMHISTGDDEQKARNLAANPRCTISTGRNTVDDDGLHHPNQADLDEAVADLAMVFAIRPRRAFAFRKGAVFSQTRYRFRG